jgi:hypothetical protein
MAFAVRSLLPVGFMLAPAQAGDGAMSIVICSGLGPQILAIDADSQPVPAKSQHTDKNQGHCPFAGALAAEQSAPVAVESTARYTAMVYRVVRDLFRSTPLIAATPTRGPPSFQT